VEVGRSAAADGCEAAGAADGCEAAGAVDGCEAAGAADGCEAAGAGAEPFDPATGELRAASAGA
jgi:hypothetical protein